MTAVSPVGNGFARVSPNDGVPPSATFLNYTSGTGITNSGAVPLDGTAPLFVMPVPEV